MTVSFVEPQDGEATHYYAVNQYQGNPSSVVHERVPEAWVCVCVTGWDDGSALGRAGGEFVFWGENLI